MAERELCEPSRIDVIERERPMRLVGCVFYGDPFHATGGWEMENEIGRLWQRCMGLFERHRDVLTGHLVNEKVMYEVHIQPDDYEETKRYYIFVGAEVSEEGEVPIDMYIKVLPGTKFGVFTFKGPEAFKGPHWIWERWLPESEEYEEAHSYAVQVYEEGRFKGLDDPESELDYMVPIRRKGGDGG